MRPPNVLGVDSYALEPELRLSSIAARCRVACDRVSSEDARGGFLPSAHAASLHGTGGRAFRLLPKPANVSFVLTSGFRTSTMSLR